MDYNRRDSFAIASLACGILSVSACCTGIMGIPIGALGIIFAILHKRKGRHMTNMEIASVWLSTVGIVLGIVFTVYSFYQVFNNPALFEEFNATFKSLYGMDFAEYINVLRNN